MAKQKKIRVKPEPVRKLFVLLGYKSAAKWDDAKLTQKIAWLKSKPETTDGVKIKNAKARRFLKEILAADHVTVGKAETHPMEKKAKAGKKDKATKKKKVAEPRTDRVTASVTVLTSIRKSGLTLDEAVAKCDTEYLNQGGSKNPKEALCCFRRVAKVLSLVGITKEDNGKIYTRKAVKVA
jgi:hypothetical protein